MALLPEGLKALKRVAKEVGLDLIHAPDDLASFLRYPLERVLMRGGQKRCGECG